MRQTSDEDRLSDLPPLPSLEHEEETLGPEGGADVEGLDAPEDGDEQVGLDAAEGWPEGLEALDLVDDLGDETSWTADGGEESGLVALDSLVSGDGQEYGHTEGTEADATLDEALCEEVGASDRPPAMDDGGEVGVDDFAADGADDDDEVSLPPLDADEPEGLDDLVEPDLELPTPGDPDEGP